MWNKLLFFVLARQNWEVFMEKLIVWLLKTFLAKEHDQWLKTVFSFSEDHVAEIATFFDADQAKVKEALVAMEADAGKLSDILFK